MKGIVFKELKAKALSNPEVKQAYDEADYELALVQLLYDMREKAGLSKTELAERLGVKPPAINRLEGNPLGASMRTLERYATACGAKLQITAIQ
ncbi:helix-turn-helix domain-containing protein [Yersinia kristensenii]|uniref:DNA-binding protein n=1 Tax=Yersinia kristensenii TaxID=28152 RepID=A0A0T9KTF7_YERKR|nr:helix-turn-helix transcriptional regulator [Yersinia kristensenii]MDA5473452.1 helix-turn-helix transcriptional regulator [Yersinia kristensenii]MDA5476806.1 helix-turn-helix transcriptional regulator [Yersinia kristensenii]MDA5505223.1 helix-turn-helix transcriptional regulator [Yersinia kristensenii]MDA5522300.1 helix-turn-helix transcriptional regulator [Yersinia kristensenii]MDR4895858.1 helix-turn-helix transcriptional regulator [Yersinia kristensenii]